MSPRRPTFVALAAVLSAFGCVMAATNADEGTLKTVADYRRWTKMTAQPLPVRFSTSVGD